MKRSTILFLAMIPLFVCAQNTKTISKEELHDKIAGAWLGQMIGNFYGLPFENKFIDQPGDDDKWPYGYTKNLDKLARTGGAFSDDDTDFEYIYLLQMEKYGCEPTYAQLREAWMYHVRDRVWLANRAALGLMYHGFTPPFTGMKSLNPHWYQIDPQLINEIWSYTAPGMITYAAQKSDWAARITSDDWAADPTVHYGAMYANAFFEKDIEKLVLNALQQLPAESRYAQTVKEMVALYKKYPNDWKKSRQEMAKKYYLNENPMTKTIWNANLNGACGVLSLLYGKGNFQLTMDLACAMGFDADNQTATVGGLLGIMYGAKALPKDLLCPIEGWTEPFNDKYINVTRYDMPDAHISDMINRTVKQAEDVILKNGGKKTGKKGKEYLAINTKASFNVPLEFYIGPNPVMMVGKPVEYTFYTAANQNYNWELKSGQMPEGIVFEKGKISGTPRKAGKYNIELSLDNRKTTLLKSFELLVRTNNIAPKADTIFTNVRVLNTEVLDSTWYTFGKPMYAKSVDVINDGILLGEGSVFYSLAAKSNLPKVDYFGYGWKEEKEINMIALHLGSMEEFGGWWSSFNIQYQDKNGKWVAVPKFKSTPELPETDIVFFQPHFVEYIFEFKPVKTKAIRIIGDTKVQAHWHKYTKNVSAFSSITELSVFEK
ncbi:MAG: ADP-ribosylglycohydrolase family protein [Bacteroidales bacterium]|nr:ADP-ribosylglycohydrolase family protein [Bacteroidales bacterium]